MKRIILCFSILMIFSSWQVHDDNNKIYELVIKSYILETKMHLKSANERTAYDHETIYVINDANIVLPGSIGGHKIQDIGDSAKKFVILDKGIVAIKLHPIRINKGRTMLFVGEYVVSFKENILNFAFAGGMEYGFNYDAKTNQYLINQKREISF